MNLFIDLAIESTHSFLFQFHSTPFILIIQLQLFFSSSFSLLNVFSVIAPQFTYILTSSSVYCKIFFNTSLVC